MDATRERASDRIIVEARADRDENGSALFVRSHPSATSPATGAIAAKSTIGVDMLVDARKRSRVRRSHMSSLLSLMITSFVASATSIVMSARSSRDTRRKP